MPSAIDPSAIPGQGLNPELIEQNAGTVGTIAGQVRDHGAGVHRSWQGMSAVYVAPEAGTVLDLMQPVNAQATQTGDNLDIVSAALISFAEAARPIKAALDQLRLDAQAFRNEIAGGVSVRELNPAWTSQVHGSWNAYGATATDVEQYRTVTKEWHEVQEYVDRNNDLISQVNAQQVALWEAERDCANRIRALYGAAPLRSAQSENDALAYGLDEIPEGTEMPWGAPVERSEGCGEATANFVFRDFLWEGVIVGGVWGTVQGLGTLALGYNPETGEFFSGDAYGAAWGNLGLLLFAGAANTGILSPLFHADTAMEQFGGGGFLPQEVRDFKARADEAAINTGKALIAWDKWQDDPGTALGESVFNVGTLLIPGAGAAVAGVKTAGTAASVISKMARMVDLIDPAAWVVNGGMRLGSAGFGSLDNLIGRIDVKPGDVDLGRVEVYAATDPAAAMRMLDDWGVDVNSVTARVDANGSGVLEFPGGAIEMPAGAFDNAAGGGVRAADGGVEASVPAPVREPELVAAGGVRGETGPGAVNSIVDEAPVRTETGGSGGDGTVIREPETTTGGGSRFGDDGGSGGGSGSNSASGIDPADAGTSGTPNSDTGSGHASISDRIAGHSDPVQSGSPGVPGEWLRVADDPITPKDLHYGEPMSSHGTSTYPQNPGGNTGFSLVDEPGAPYGRHPDGSPLTQADYDSRYVFPGNNWDNYPPNAGAVRGSRVQYRDIDAFVRDYGDLLDRVGPPSGDYLGVRPDGVAASFEQRGLPVSSLKKEVFNYQLTGYLPDGWTLEISKIAPAFGQPGGAFQLLVRDGAGSKLPVSVLDTAGVLRVERWVS